MKKKFDCVEMKDEIQRKLHMRRAGMSDRVVQAQLEKELKESPSPVARYWRAISGDKVGAPRDRSMVKC